MLSGLSIRANVARAASKSVGTDRADPCASVVRSTADEVTPEPWLAPAEQQVQDKVDDAAV